MKDSEDPSVKPIAGGPSHADETYLVVLERLANARGVEQPSALAEASSRTQRDVVGDWDSTWQDRLVADAEEMGILAQDAWLAPSEVVGSLRPSQPVVTFRRSEANPSGWILLTDRRLGGTVFRDDLSAQGRGEWITMDQLALELGCDETDRVPWLVSDPIHPVVPEGEHHHGSVSPIERLREICRPDRGDLWAIVVFGMLVGLMTLAIPLAVQQLVNSVALGGLIQPVVVLALLLLGCLGFSAVLTGLEAFVAEIVQRRIFVRVVADLAHRLPRVNLGAYDRRNGPELVNRFFDVVTVQKIGSTLLLDGVALTLQTLIGLLVLSFYHPLMLAFSVVLLVGIGVVTFGFGRGAIPTSIAESQAKYAVQAWLEELARHAPQLKTSGAARFALERADGLTRQYLRARATHYRIVLRQLIGALGLQVVANSLLLGLGGGLVIVGQLTLGQLVASELIVTVIVASFAKLGKHLESFYDLMAAVDKLGMLFDLPLERSHGTSLEGSQAGLAVSFREVSFRYGDEEEDVVKDLSFDIAAGERVALIGPSGSGKTTVLDVAHGLRAPTGGYVTLDGADLRELRLDSVREDIARVRGAEILEASLEENVRMGRQFVTNRDVREALEAVGLLDEALELSDGLETRLTSGGAPLSGGAVIRLALARAIAGRPRLVLLDEPLVEQDPELRERVANVLCSPDAPWTVVVTSVEGENVRFCDRVIRLPGDPHGTSTPTETGVSP